MPTGFEAYDDQGKLQFSSEASAYYVHDSFPANIVNVANSFGRVTVPLTNPSELVAFRSTAAAMAGFRRAADYTIYTATLAGTIDIRILRPFRLLSPAADSFGLQVLSSTGDLLYSAARKAVTIFGVVSVYGEDGIGDVGDFLVTGAGTNPYALILGNEFISYTGEQGTDAIERMIVVETASNAVTAGTARRSEWPGMPSNGGTEYSGTFTVAALL